MRCAVGMPPKAAWGIGIPQTPYIFEIEVAGDLVWKSVGLRREAAANPT